MKTTVEIQDGLFAEARTYVSTHNTTMKALIEQGLRKMLAENKKAPTFKLRDASFYGDSGLTPEFQDASWEKIRDTIYEGRG